VKIRGLIRPTGQHRAIATRAELFSKASAGAVVTQAFRYCVPCQTETSAVLHRTGHTCGECGHTHYPQDGAE
jgi:NADH pyrophosphatase NudC (nudix superfamily)